MAAVAILKNHKNRDITTTDWPILVKFGIIMQIGPFRGETVKISKFWKSKMAERKQQPTTEGEAEVLVYSSQIQTQENKKSKYKCNNVGVRSHIVEYFKMTVLSSIRKYANA